MRHNPVTNVRFFFTTQSMACPYLDDKVERRLVTELSGREAMEINDRLSITGFRRSHTVAYIPVCEDCNSCVSVRIPVRDFVASKSQRKILNRNNDITVVELPPIATEEQFDLFKVYINSRHSEGDMAVMDYLDYTALLEDTPVRTSIAEFRDQQNQLLACCIIDRVNGGLSAVYSFFTNEQDRRSLGTYIILWLINRTKDLGLSHVYLGYWVSDSPKMDYKKKFFSLEGYGYGDGGDGNWGRI